VSDGSQGISTGRIPIGKSEMLARNPYCRRAKADSSREVLLRERIRQAKIETCGGHVRERWILLTMLGLSIVCGCTNQGPRQTNETAPSAVPPRSEGARPERPATKRGTITLEGDAEPITLKLFDSGSASLPVPFTTYVPEDMIPEPSSSGTQKAIRFVANFGGHREEEAYMEVLFDPPDARGADLSKEKSASDKQFTWSLMEQNIRSVSISGDVVRNHW
jgi:hypothetical protein